MRAFFPKSLLGQMLLAVALALLVAQAISVFLLYQAEQRRIENGLINELAFQLVVDRQAAGRIAARGENERFRPRAERGARGPNAGPGTRPRRIRIERATESPLAEGELRNTDREAALREVLQEQGVVIADLVVLSRQIAQDGYILERLAQNPRFLERRQWNPQGELVVAGLKRQGSDQWAIVRSPRPASNRGALVGIIIQTLILYIVLIGGLGILLRRLTRPLAQLTRRVENFGGSLGTEPPLEPSGPEDARRLITAHSAMEARISALLDEKNVMLGAIGHDLKTPLAALRVRIESVDNEAERAKMAATIEDITTSLDDILSLARVGHPTDPLERTELSALVASVVEEYEDMGDDVALGALERIALPLRATWLRRALRNLIGNALRYGGQAHISLKRDGDQAVIGISDNGPGIPEAQLADMLEPFTRGEASRNRATGGAGLGLTLARAIAEQHGGALSLANRTSDSGEVEGLLAEIRLPLE